MWLAFKGGMFLRWLQLEAFAKAWGGSHPPTHQHGDLSIHTETYEPSGLGISVCRGLLVAGLYWSRVRSRRGSSAVLSRSRGVLNWESVKTADRDHLRGDGRDFGRPWPQGNWPRCDRQNSLGLRCSCCGRGGRAEPHGFWRVLGCAVCFAEQGRANGSERTERHICSQTIWRTRRLVSCSSPGRRR